MTAVNYNLYSNDYTRTFCEWNLRVRLKSISIKNYKFRIENGKPKYKDHSSIFENAQSPGTNIALVFKKGMYNAINISQKDCLKCWSRWYLRNYCFLSSLISRCQIDSVLVLIKERVKIIPMQELKMNIFFFSITKS